MKSRMPRKSKFWRTNELAPVSIKTSVKEAKEIETAKFDKFKVYKVDKDNVISVFSESHPVDREAANDSEAVQDNGNQSSSSNQGRILPRTSRNTSGPSIQSDRNVPSEHGGHNDDGPETNRACLDVKLARTSTGAEVFAALEGAGEKGLDTLHFEKRFLGYENKAESLKDVHIAHIFGKHVDDYMRNLPEENEEDKYDEDEEGEDNDDASKGILLYPTLGAIRKPVEHQLREHRV